MDARQYKQNINSDLKELLESDVKILTAWEGGSAATGFQDDFSDLDLAVVCEDEHVEKVFFSIENYLEKKHGIKAKFRMPEPTWHGHSQCFYLLKDSPKHYYVDLAVMKESSKDKLTQSDRHGKAVVWFDKKSMIDVTPTDEDELKKKCSAFYEKIRSGPQWLWEIESKKNCDRKHFIDAKTNYDVLVHRNLAGLLNLKYRKNKFDFGLRYSERDYPPDVFKKVEQLLFITSTEELPEKLEMVLSMIDELNKELFTEYG